MLATPESVDSSRASPESGVLAAEVFVLDPSLGNENSPGKKKSGTLTRWWAETLKWMNTAVAMQEADTQMAVSEQRPGINTFPEKRYLGYH
jgi:hypothetical protein